MARFEYVRGNSRKFWEIKKSGYNVTITYGRIGSKGRTMMKPFATMGAAKEYVEKQIAAKLKKNYVEVSKKKRPTKKKTRAKKKTKKKAKKKTKQAAEAKGAPGFARYESASGKSAKFWELRVRLTETAKSKRARKKKPWMYAAHTYELTTRSGRFGSKVQEKTKPCNRARAMVDWVTTTRRKQNQGYTLAPDTARENTRSARSPAMEKRILNDPSDENFKVYADWLQSQGDPRGELMAIDAALDAKPSAARRRKLRARRKTLLELYPTYLQPHLLMDFVKGKPERGVDGGLLKGQCLAVWRQGHLDSVRIGIGDRAGAIDRDSHCHPYGAIWLTNHVLTHPSARFLRELVIGPVQDVDRGWGTHMPGQYAGVMVSIIAAAPVSLRTLHFTDTHEVHAIERAGKLWPAVPNLEELVLRGGAMFLGKIKLPKLKKVRIESLGLQRTTIKSIVNATWPKLESMELLLGRSGGYGGHRGVSDLQPILDGKGLKKLTHLGIMNCEFTDDAMVQLSRAKILRQLHTLSLWGGTGGDAVARVLVDNAKAFKRVKQIDLSQNWISAGAARRIKKAYGKRVDLRKQRKASGAVSPHPVREY